MKPSRTTRILLCAAALLLTVLAYAGIADISGTGPAGTQIAIKATSAGEAKTLGRAYTAPGTPVAITLPTDAGYACAGPAVDGGCGNTLAIATGDCLRIACNNAAGSTQYLFGTTTAAPTAATGNPLPSEAVERLCTTVSTQTAIGFTTGATSGTPKCFIAKVGEAY